MRGYRGVDSHGREQLVLGAMFQLVVGEIILGIVNLFRHPNSME